MDFSKYNQSSNNAYNSLQSYKNDIAKNLGFLQRGLDVLGTVESSFRSAVALTDASAIEQALRAGTEDLLSAREELMKVQNFAEESEELLNNTCKDLQKYDNGLKPTATEMNAQKIAIVFDIEQMRKAFVRKNKETNSSINLDKIDKFKEEMKLMNFCNMQDSKRKVLKAFETMVDTHWHLFSIYDKADAVRESVGNEERAGLTKLLEDAEKFSSSYQHVLNDFDRSKQDSLIVQIERAVNNMTTDLELAKLKGMVPLKEGSIKHLQQKLLAKYNELGGANASLQQELAAVKIPPSIDWIAKAYLVAEWVYEKAGKTVGEKVGLPQKREFSKELLDKEYSCDFSLPIPTGPLQPVLSADLLFGASFAAKATVSGAMELHNFFDIEERKYLSGNIEGKLTVNADVYLGLAVTVLHIARAAGKAKLGGESEITLTADTSLNKGEETNKAFFEANCGGAFKFELYGQLELTVGLTPTLCWIVETISGTKPEKTYTSSRLKFMVAERNANFKFKMPFKSKNIHIPDNLFNFDKGDWNVSYPASDSLRGWMNKQLIGDEKDQERLVKEWLVDGALTDEEKAQIRAEYTNPIVLN